MVLNISKQTGYFFERTQTVTQYYSEVNKYKVLTQEEENECFRIYNDPNSSKIEKERAREKVIKANLRFVISAANQFSRNSNYLDVIQVGNIALINAFEKFRIDKGAKFTTYAVFYINRDIRQYLNNEDATIRQTNSSKTSHLIAKARNKFIQQYEREPSNAELAMIIEDEYGVTIIDDNDVASVNVISIDETVSSSGDDEEACVGDLEYFNSYTACSNDYEKTEERDYNMSIISTLMNVLTEREKQIILMKYGVGTEKPLDTDEISEIMSLSKERVRQLISLATSKMQEEAKKRAKKLR